MKHRVETQSYLRQAKDYRHFLRNSLEQRRGINPHYSLRAFARDLQLSPSNLSEILKGIKGLSVATASRIGERLGLSDGDLAFFCDLVQAEHARSPVDRKIARTRIGHSMARDSSYHVLSLDTFRIISDWQHYAILELLEIPGFDPRPLKIAKRLGLTAIQAREAVERLKRVGLLELKDGKLVKAQASVTTTHDVPSEAVRNFHLQILNKASQAIVAQPVSRRDYSAMLMAIDPAKLPEAKEKIAGFRRSLTEFLESGPRTTLYCLGIQLFDLTQKE